MPSAITVLVNPKETYKRTDLIKKLETKFKVYVDSIFYEPILVTQKYGSSNHCYFIYENDTISIIDDDIIDMMPPHFVITLSNDTKVDKKGWKIVLQYLRYICGFEYNGDLSSIEELALNIIDVQTPPAQEKIYMTDTIMPPPLPTEYSYIHYKDESRDLCYCEITKPHTDRPYTVVIRRFSERGFLPLFTSLYIDLSWGITNADHSFLKQLWNYLEMEGELDLPLELQRHVERCSPNGDNYPEMEPEVFRETIEQVKTRFERLNKRLQDIQGRLEE